MGLLRNIRKGREARKKLKTKYGIKARGKNAVQKLEELKQIKASGKEKHARLSNMAKELNTTIGMARTVEGVAYGRLGRAYVDSPEAVQREIQVRILNAIEKGENPNNISLRELNPSKIQEKLGLE